MRSLDTAALSWLASRARRAGVPYPPGMLCGAFRSFQPWILGFTLAVGSLSSGCKNVTETVVEQTVKAAKDTSKGIEEGVEKGRKEGQSADDAFLVTTPEDLKGKGTLSLYAVRALSAEGRTEVDLAVENTTDRPMRVTKLDVLALDSEGFVMRPTVPPREITVPPRAKEKIVVPFEAKAAKLAKVRVWGTEYDAPPKKP